MSGPGYVALLRENRVFRRYWLGQLVSFLGDWFTTVALYVAVEELSSSGRAVALVLVSKTLPIFLVSPLAGPLVDRFDRRRLLLATDFARAAGALGLIAAHQAGSLVALYACVVWITAHAGVAIPAKNAVLPMIVDRATIPRANALAGGTWSAMLALGAASGGLATEFLGIDASFLIDAGTFLASAAFFAGLPPLPPPRQPGVASAGLAEGLRYLRQRPDVLALACMKPSMQLAGGVFALLPLYGTRVFESGGALLVGVLYGVRGLGSLLGSLGMRLVFGDRPQTMRVLLVACFLGLGVTYFLLSRVHAPWQAVACFGGTGLWTGTIWVFSGTLLQTEAAGRFHGRVFALEFGALTLTLAASGYLGGAAVDAGFSVREVTAGFAPLPLVGAAIAVGLVAGGRRARSAAGNRPSPPVVSRSTDERPRAG